MTDTKRAAPTAAKARQAPKHIPDPTFTVSADRPKDIITARGLNAPPAREHKPLTAAVLNTLTTGGTVDIKYSKDAHDRLMGRFKGIEQRRKTEIVIKYSLVLGDDHVPTHVRYWCEPVPPPDPVPPPAPPPEQPLVGHHVE